GDDRTKRRDYTPRPGSCRAARDVLNRPKKGLPMRELMIIFATVFVAELGDKTQLATLVFAADGKTHPLGVFLAAAAALVLGTGLSVLIGWMGGRYLEHVP